jgi:hypothetical protein
LGEDLVKMGLEWNRLKIWSRSGIDLVEIWSRFGCDLIENLLNRELVEVKASRAHNLLILVGGSWRTTR